MVRNIILIILLFMALVFISFKISEEDPLKKKQNVNSDNSSAVVDSKKMDANSISAWYRTNGSFNRDPATGNAGFEWLKGSGMTARYASGIWLGCVSGNDTLTAVAEYAYDYLPGYVDNSGNPQTDSSYRIYIINKNEINSYDYLHWPGNQGAYKTTDGKPYLMGDQTMFFVYTDGFPHGSGSTSLRSLNAQILQTNWAFNSFGIQDPSFLSSSLLSNIIYSEYRVINRSNQTWNNMWFSVWTDDDLGTATDDKVGCDTSLEMAYTYNASNYDGVYGTAPPSVGFKFINGGMKYTGNIFDTVKYYSPPGSNNIVIKTGYKDLGMTVFNYYNGGSPQPTDPLNNTETFRVITGYWRLGDRWVNPYNNLDTTITPFAGDPVTGSGWNIPGDNDRRFVMSTGPMTVDPGDTIVIVTAQVVARGSSNLNSITQLRRVSKLAQNYYDLNFKSPEKAISPNVTSYAPGDGKIYLTINDTAEKISIPNKLSGGTYYFQGYNIYQIKTFSNNPSQADTVLLKTFDKTDGIKDIKDSIYLDEYQGIFYGVVQKGSDNGISRYIVIDRDSINNTGIINGSEYKFAVTSYYYDSLGGIFTYPKVNESPVSNIIKIVPQNISPGTKVSYSTGDTIKTDQNDLAVMPIVIEPLKLVNAQYISTFGGTDLNPNWTVTKNSKGNVTVLFENIYNFTGNQDSLRKADGLLFSHQIIRDSGIVKDPDDPVFISYGIDLKTNQKCWTYEPQGKEWFTSPDTTAIKTAKFITNRQFQSRSLGISFPTIGNFRNSSTRVKANAKYFQHAPPAGSPIFSGGPLRKIKIVFGQNQKAYRYRPASGNVLLSDTNLSNTPYADMTDIPFSVFAADELDSSGGTPRQLNVAFIDPDNDGIWNPDTTKLGGYQFTYILASDYNEIPDINYTGKNPGVISGTIGFPGFDIMYAWLPRVKNVNGVPAQRTSGDVLTVTPYRITRPDFVPGYPVKYTWEVKGTEFGNRQLASSEVNSIKAFPNPYYGFSSLELNDAGDKFIYFSHLPQSCTIFIYTLDGTLVKSIYRNQTDPQNTLEKWNLQNEGGSYVASGMYLLYVDCKDLGAKTLKIAVFTR